MIIAAEFLGFNESIKPFAIANDRDILKGVNYASGAAGIREETGWQLVYSPLTNFRFRQKTWKKGSNFEFKIHNLVHYKKSYKSTFKNFKYSNILLITYNSISSEF